MSGTSMSHARGSSARTVFLAVTGLGSAALVTSISALSAGSDEIALAVAVVGGTCVLAIAAFVTLVVAVRSAGDPDRGYWAVAGVALMLTSLSSGMRAGQMLAGETFVQAGVSEWIYMAAMCVLAGVLVGWPLRHGGSLRLATVLPGSLAAWLAATGSVWWFFGRAILESAGKYGGIGPKQAQSFLEFLAVFCFAIAFSLVAAAHLRTVVPVGQWVLVSVAAALIVIGDLAWLSDVTDSSWLPGSLGDFAHISGHVLVAVAASLHRDLRIGPAAGAGRRPAAGLDPNGG